MKKNRPNRDKGDPRIRTHSNVYRWDRMGFTVEEMRKEGLDDSQIAELLKVTPRTVKARRSRIK